MKVGSEQYKVYGRLNKDNSGNEAGQMANPVLELDTPLLLCFHILTATPYKLKKHQCVRHTWTPGS